MLDFITPPARRLLCYLLLIAIVPSLAVADLLALEPTRETEIITHLSAPLISKRHYTQRPIDEKLSADLFDEYFKMLDPNKMFFSKQDIESFAPLREKLAPQLLNGKPTFPFEVFNRYLEKLSLYDKFCNEQLDKGFDFSQKEEFEPNRAKADWLPNDDALKDYWRKKLKSDVLSLMIFDKASKEDPTLGKRASDKNAHPSWSTAAVSPAERVRRRIDQSYQTNKKFEPIDVLAMFLSCFARIYDPHSDYMKPSEDADFDIAMKLSLVGIGALLSSDEGYTKIEKIIPGGPAALEGSLSAGDRISAVAQEGAEPADIMNMRIDRVVSLIRGKKGTKVTLTVHDGAKGVNAIPRQITILRDVVKLEDSAAKGVVREVTDATGRKLKIGVISLPSFYMDFDAAMRGDADYKSSTRDVAKILEKFKAEGIDGVILDLRSNGGGSLPEAVSLSGLFIKSGPVVQIRGTEGIEVKYDEDNDAIAWNGPLAVMVNRLSASSTEIFAAAIKDYNRGVVIGDAKTHGKGSVQTVIQLKSYLMFIPAKFPAGAVKFTNAKFYRINGSSTQLKGVTPDIVFPAFTDHMELGEEKLDHALPWDSISATDYKAFSDSLPKIIPQLRERSEKRLAANKDFQLLLADMAEFSKNKDRKTFSLNFDTRWQEYLHEKKILDEQIKLLHLSERAGDDIDDVKDDGAQKPGAKKIQSDIYLDEALNIVSDLAGMEGKPAPAKP